MLCPRCQTENPAQARFCMNCGEPVLSRTPADEARFARLAASTPEPLQHKLRTAVIQGEVRPVAVLLVDVVASARLAEQLEPETYAVVINAAFDRIAPLVYRYEGTIARLLGDSLLAFFGAPVAHEDDPVRAVRTALEVIEAREAFAAEILENHGVSFALRACLHLGEVVFNTQADSLQYEFDAPDGAVNVVSRLKFAAGPNTILITEPLYRRVAPFFECQPGEEISIQGSAQPVQVYTVKSMIQQDTRLRGLPGLTSPMVGREAELRTLLQQVEAVRAGLGRAVLITGEPGLGKTRLVDEWQNSSRLAAPDGLYWTQGRCMSFSESQPYSLLVDWLRDVFELAQAAGELQAGRRLTDRLEACLDLQVDELRSVFAYLLSLPLEAEDLAQIESLEPLARQARYVLAVQQLVRSLAQTRPLVIVLEDLHWADPSSTELFNRLLPLTDKLPLLLCLVSREEPEAAGWTLVSTARQRLRGSLVELHLGPLTDQDSQALVANLLEIEALPDTVRALILQRTEGNPFFVEEVIRMLIEQGVIVRQGGDWVARGDIESVEIPDILQSLLLARIDRLPREAREALLVAAVIGRQFPVKVLAGGLSGSMPEINLPDVHLPDQDLPDQDLPNLVHSHQRAHRMTLTSQLNTLESAGLVRIAQYEPEVEYLFRHALIQDAAYSLLLSTDRTRLHALVGETIERLYTGHLDAYAALLAYHFERAGDRGRAFEYHRRAGESALASYANREAEIHFRRALEFIESRDQQAACLGGLGEAHCRQSFYTKALEAWRQAIDRYLHSGNYDQAAQLYARSGRLVSYSGDYEEGLRICKQGLQAVGRAPGSHGLAMLIHEAGRAYSENNQKERAREYCQRALVMAEQLGAVDVQAEVLTTRSNLPDWPISDCRRDLERAIALAEPAGQLSAAFRAHNNLGDLLAMQLGQQEQAYQHFMRAAELCRQQGFVREELFVRLNVVRLLTNRFELDRAEENLQIIRFRLAIVIEDERDGIYVDFRQAVLDWLRGNLSKALAGLERIRHLARRVRDSDNWFRAVWELLWIQVDAYFWGHAVDLDDLYELGHGLLQDEFSAQFYAYAMQSTICSLRGEIDEARHYLTAAQQIMAPDWPNEWLFVEFSRFYILLAEDQQDQALVVLEELLNSSILDALLVEKTRARSYQAELYRRRGRPVDLEEARRIFREIEQFTGQLGVRYYQQIAQGRLEMLRQEMLDKAVDHEQVSREMANAGRVQASFLPQVLPEVSGWELAAELSPARQTSGDFYDFIPLPEDRLAFLVADVADKGAGAALFMALTHGLLRTYTAAYPDDPAHVLFETNQRLLADSSRALFVTLFYGVLEVQTGRLAYCNAGHNPPYYVPAESHNPLQLLALTGIPLGIDPDATWQSRELALRPDGLLVLYTDGVTEAQNEDGAYFGEDPLEERLQASRGASAQTVLDALSADLAAFVGAAPQTDDITLLVLRRADRAT